MALDTSRLISELQPLLGGLREDLLARAKHPSIRAGLESAYRKEQAAQRTADTFEIWCRGRATQVAAAWVLSVIFVRTLEDRGLIDRRRIAGPGAEDSEEQFVSIAPFLTARDYLLTVFRELGRLPGVEGIFDARHNPVWVLAPSGDGARRLLDFFRQKDESGALRFAFEGTDTRFLGDLYQDLDADVRARYALLQTPDFVESFILDGTLTPAIKTFGLKEVKLIDPTCGSGHFLLGAFRRLFEAWRQAEPVVEPHVHALRAMGQVFAADLNPYAVAIARFRLTLAFLEVTGITRLEKAPPLVINVCVADSLLHGTSQTMFSERPGAGGRAAWGDDLFALEDEVEALRILGARYHVVVGNPPYITEKDRARRELYRSGYESAAGKFALAAPFTERFFGLAAAGGFVGMINANSFMKREFGKKLIEVFLPRVELTEVVDTSGAFIPGHGTPTVILFGKNQRRGNTPVLAVMGKLGEPSTPEDPANGPVWLSIRDHHREVGFENEYVSVAEVERERLEKHPWSLGGGGAAELKELLETRSEATLADVATSIGFMAITGEDDVFVRPPHAWNNARVPQEHRRAVGAGEGIRDWGFLHHEELIFPYDATSGLLVLEQLPAVQRALWPWRRLLHNRPDFGGKKYIDVGRPWYEFHQIPIERLRTPLSVAFAEIATHNHFILDFGGRVFNRTAPIIKLRPDAPTEEHFALLGYLNSSVACFWIKQSCQPKYSANQKHNPDPSRRKYQVNGERLKSLPLPPLRNSQLIDLARALHELGSQRAELLTGERLRKELDGGASRTDLEGHVETLFRAWMELTNRMVVLQEELDWVVYDAFGLASHETSVAIDALKLTSAPPGSRPFELLTGSHQGFTRRVGVEQTLVSKDAVPQRWLQREASVRDGWLSLVETPIYKRAWRLSDKNVHPEDVRNQLTARWLSAWLLGKCELVFGKQPEPRAIRVRQLIDSIDLRDTAIAAAAMMATDVQLPEHRIAELVQAASVPYLASERYSETGIEKYQQWQATWALQRLEDAGAQLQVPPPPAFDTSDFRKSDYWRHRGKLDVPKERFISYPGAESDDDPSPLIGWAGWDHLQQATALAALYQKRKDEDGWERDRLNPLLAGLLELVPWLKQWHNEPAARFGGLRQGDFFETFVQGEARRLGLTTDDLRAWRPIRAAGRRRGAASRGAASNGTPRPVRSPRAHTADELLQAITTLDTGDGVEQRALAEHLGASGPAVGRLAQELLDQGRLELLSARPKRLKVVPSGEDHT